MIRHVSSGSALRLLRNLSSRFAAILVYAQFWFLPLSVVIYVWSLMVNLILKIKHNFDFYSVSHYRVSYTEKNKKTFFDVYLPYTRFIS